MSKPNQKQACKINTDGTIEYWVDGQRHRDPKDGPAFIWVNGSIKYYVNGRLNRDPKDGPAIIRADGSVEYWVNDKQVKAPS
jgi:hypothetical protein